MQDNTLSKFGFIFQVKIVSCLMTDTAFCGQMCDLLKDEYFDAVAMKFLINTSIDYYIKYKRTPTLESFKVALDKEDDDVLRQEVIRCLKDAHRHVNSSDLEMIKDETLEFCKNQTLKNAIMASVHFLKQGDYESIKNMVGEAFNIGMDTDVGLDYIKDIETRYSEDARSPVPSDWAVLNEYMKGGLSPGELGIVMAATGLGKSWMLQAIGAAAVKQGKNVVHYSLELNESYTGIRYDCILSGISLDKIQHHVSTVKDVVEKLPGNLIIKYFPTKSISIEGIRSHLNKMITLGNDIDLVIVDYADLLRFSNTKIAKHEALELLYEELRGLGGEYQVPVWTASQVNKEGSSSHVVEGTSASGAYAKIFPADFVISLSRKIRDKLSNKARMHIVKSRLGPDGITFPMLMDTSRGRIEVYEEIVEDGIVGKEDNQIDKKFERNYMKHKLQELTGG